MAAVVPFLLLLLLSVCSLLLTRLLTVRAGNLGLLDIPGARSAHTVPRARGGGLAVVTVFTGFVVWLYAAGTLPLMELALFLLAVPVAVTGLLDDLYSLSHRWRIISQLLMAVAVFSLLRELPPLRLGGVDLQLGLSAWLLVPLALTWLCNLYNFMDGIDGLAASQCCFVCAAAAWLTAAQSPLLTLLCLALFAATAGFLVWNWAPAHIFMGDVGSTWTGFVLGLLILISLRDQTLTIWVWFLLLSVFIADTGWTLAARLRRGHRPYEAHNTHAYQRAARRFGHAPVVLAVLLINLVYLLPLAWMAESHPEYGIHLAISGIVPLCLLCWFLGAGQDNDRPARSADDSQGPE